MTSKGSSASKGEHGPKQGNHELGEGVPRMQELQVHDLAQGQADLDLLWQHASPNGGMVSSDCWPRFNVEVGHVIQVKGRWAVVQDIQRNDLGMYHFITWHGCLCVYSRFDAVIVRTDYRLQANHV
jgi:hypothetical protein